MNAATETLITIGTAIVGVAIIAVLVSQRSNTAGVLQAMGSAFSNALGVAVSPVTGSNIRPSGAYPTSGAGSLGLGLNLGAASLQFNN